MSVNGNPLLDDGSGGGGVVSSAIVLYIEARNRDDEVITRYPKKQAIRQRVSDLCFTDGLRVER